MVATNTSPEYLDSLKRQAESVQNTLQTSPTAYADNLPASSFEVAQSNKLANLNSTIDSVRSTQLRNKWYGQQDTQNQTDQPPVEQNWIFKGLSALQKPLNAIVGAEQWALGKGSDPSLFGNINSALKQGLTSGDVLKQFNVPRAVQIPLGFMLDVFQDPVNWLTAGTEALIPRVGAGFIKGATEGGITGGLEAAKTGLVSGLERKLAKVLPYKRVVQELGTPGAITVGKEVTNVLANGASVAGEAEKTTGLLNRFSDAYKNFTTNVGARAIVGSDKYDALMGTNVYDKLGKNYWGLTDLNAGKTMGSFIESKIRSLPHGDDIADFFKYSTQAQVEQNKLADRVFTIGKSQNFILTKDKGKEVIQDVSELLKPGAPVTVKDKLVEAMQENIANLETFSEPIKVADTFENAQKLLKFAGEDYSVKNLIAAYKPVIPGEIGVGWYDDLKNSLRGVKNTEADIAAGKDVYKIKPITVGDVLDKIHAGTFAESLGIYNKVKDWTPFKTIIDANDALMKLFKLAKVPASVSAHVYAWSGNLTMGWMMGIPIEDPEFIKGLVNTRNFLSGRNDVTFIKNNFFNDVNSWVDYIDNNPHLFRQVAGFDPKTIGSKMSVEQRIKTQYGVSFDEVLGVLRKDFDNVVASEYERAVRSKVSDLEQKVARTTEETKALNDIKNYGRLNPPDSSIQTVQKMKYGEKTSPAKVAEMAKEGKGNTIYASEYPTGWGATELGNNNWLDTLKARIEDKALNPNTPITEQAVYKAANFVMNKMPNMYEKIDQTYKINTVKFLSVNGIPENNLIKISRQVPITKEDIVNVYTRGGQKLYRLTPQKASEVAIETFMNYSAMPDFVKVLRDLPILGSPFISFSYATAAKAGKTLVNNPSFFNNVAFLMNEISGERTPQEKEALKQKYNEYLNSPTVVKLGGMWNTDVKTMLPYLTMNMLNSSQKNYDNSFPSELVKTIDASPFMKHPLGQLMFDYFVQPAILSGTGQTPEMQFGEPLYPSFDESGRKIDPSLATKTFYAARQGAETFTPGVASYAGLLGGLLPDSVLNAVPSFGFRQVGNATLGRNTLGVTTKENPVQKTLRAIAGRSGFSVYPLDATKTNVKK